MGKNNSNITYSTSGIGWTNTQTVRGVVTKYIVKTSRHQWSKDGKEKGKTGMYLCRLVEYVVDGKEPVKVEIEK